jgi:hypothetical protein
MDPAEYCRQIETYLCRKNEGHLIRIVGPAFEQVSGWAAQGVPLAVAYRGIDQYCERYYAKGPRRRPVRIEFCEGDVLTLFDDWRRAVGVRAARAEGDEPAPDVPRDSLPAHIDRAIALLTIRCAENPSPALAVRIDDTVRELDRLKGAARQARGESRAAIVARLSELDAHLVGTARDELDASTRADLRARAEAEIAPFAARMAGEARTGAIERAFLRLVRDHAGLPLLTSY